MTQTIARFGGDNAKGRAESFCEERQKADPQSYYEVEDPEDYPPLRFQAGQAAGIVISHLVVKI